MRSLEQLPAVPDNWLVSPLALADGVEQPGLSRLSSLSSSDQIDQTDQTNQPILSLRQVGPIGFLTQAFAVESAGCQS
jgi:hypothetical protein